MSDELVAWLLGCLDDVERVARAAPAGPWTYRRVFSDLSGAEMDGPIIHGDHSDGYIDPESAEHIVRHDPARVLAQVAATRLLIKLHQRRDGSGYGEPDTCMSCVMGTDTPEFEPWPCLTLRVLAQPYASEPGWQEAWRTDA